MKNLKKVLSLVLALAMALSLMTVAFAADASDYKDYNKVTYKQAVDVMTSVGVFNGTGDGTNFTPDGTLTREQAAKIITYMLLGQEAADKLTATIAPYSDVAATRWSAGAIAYCTNEGILAGTGNGKFNPTGELTGLEFAKMLLVALGYDATIEQLTGSAWAINTSKLALGDANLDEGMESVALSATLTREQAAQMAFNAMQATLVEYTDNGSSIVLPGDIVINTNPSKATPVTSKVKAEATNISDEKTTDGQWTVEFAEKYCKDLKLTSSDTDTFERPASTWKYKNSDIGTYADTADVSYTKEVNMGTIYSDLDLSRGIAKENVTIYVDGQKSTAYAIVKGDTTNKLGGNGALTQVYYDDDAGTVTITVVNTYLGKITGTRAASSTRDAYVTMEAKTGPGSTYETDTVYAVDDYVLYTYSYKTGDVGVQSMQIANSVTGTLSAYTVGKSVTVAGQAYDSNVVQASKDTITSALANAMKTDVTVYLDSYGYAIYVDADAAADNYAVVMGWTGSNSVGVNTNRTATLLFADGTTKSVNVTKDTEFAVDDKTLTNAAINTGDIVSYRINSDNEYKLTVLADTVSNSTTGSAIITKGNSTISLTAGKVGAPTTATVANGSTEFVFYNANNNTYSTYTGIANVPTVKLNAASKVTVYTKGATNVAKFIYVEIANATISSSSKDVIFVLGDSSGVSHDSDLGDYYTYDAVVNGEITKIKTETGVNQFTMFTNVGKNSKDVYNLTNANYVNAGHQSDANGELTYTTGTDKVENGSITLGNKVLSVAKDCKVFRISTDGKEISEISASSIVKDTGTYADKVWYKTTDGEVTTIVIQTVDETVTPSNPGNTNYTATIDTNLLTASVTGPDTVATAKENNIKNAVANAVKAAGYTVTAWGGSYNTGNGTGLTVSIVLGTTTSGVPTTLAITYAQQA